MTTQQAVMELAQEFDVTDPGVISEIQSHVQDVTVQILSQNDGRFSVLESDEVLTITANTEDFLLPPEFNTAQDNNYIVDANSAYIADFNLVTKKEHFRRLREGTYETSRHGFIIAKDSPTPGLYLRLGTVWTEDGYIQLFYYRKATGWDTDLIKEPSLVKDGVRERMPNHCPSFQYAGQRYQRSLPKYREGTETRVGQITLRPGYRTRRLNRLMHEAGATSVRKVR
jgi:hypothetical protein